MGYGRCKVSDASRRSIKGRLEGNCDSSALSGIGWPVFNFFDNVIAVSSGHFSMVARHTIFARHRSTDDDVGMLLYRSLRAWGRLSGPLHIASEVSLTYELLNMVPKVVAFLCVMVIISVETAILRLIPELSWSFHGVKHP
ncbi:hypothetical protein GW17_00022166 [Ensete ventricosum]|nr:hypothetical protein GW17_00022166 [Ensete ventricosum]